MPLYFCTFLPDGTLTYVNTALAAMTGQPPEALLGRPFFEMISPEDEKVVRAALAGLTPERPVETHEQTDRAPDGKQRWQQWTNRATYDADGRIARFQAVGLDITDLRGAEAALRRANRALTLLSGITRHDIDNQLAVLRGFLSLARAEEGSPAVAAFLERSMAAGERIATLIRFTGAWEGMGARPPAWLDARAVVEDAAQEVDPGVVAVANDLPADLRVWADAICTRVAAGLIENALRHGVSATTVRFSAEETGDGGLLIVCEDDGAGVPADAKERIFERGYGENSGLGLFLAREALGLTGIAITRDRYTGSRGPVRDPGAGRLVEGHSRPLIGPVTRSRSPPIGCPRRRADSRSARRTRRARGGRAAVRAADRSLARVVLFRPCIPGPDFEPARRRRPELDHDEVVDPVAVGALELG